LIKIIGYFKIKKGDRVAQAIISPVAQCEIIESELSETERSDGGFGHTGKE
jgi:dUTP pyrophosphatase